MPNSDHTAVNSLIDEITNDQRRSDAAALLRLLAEATGEEPKLWSAETIGFGQYHYKYLKTGEEGDFFTVGFSPRKDHITLYIMSGLRGFEDILERLGSHSTGKSTVHIRRLADIDEEALIELVTECVKHVAMVERSRGAIPRMSDIPPRKT